MNVMREIFEWSKDLPSWQSDAIRRIYEKDSLTEQDIDDLTALAKLYSGISDPKGRAPQAFKEKQVPQDIENQEVVRLLAIRDLENVNAIAPGQALEFSDHGLTVIYGDNGAGKSGYARVLKRVCRARDENEPVLPDARKAEVGLPQAIVRFRVGEQEQNTRWVEGSEPPAALSRVAVLDTRSARIYLDEENELSVQPYGLDIPEKLANVCDQVKARINREAEELHVNPEEFKDLIGDTAVGAAVTRLSGDIEKEDFENLAAMTEEEFNRLAELKKIVNQSNPAAEAKRLSRLNSRIREVRERAIKINEMLSSEVISSLRELDTEWRAAEAAAEVAAQRLMEGENLLPGTGGSVWKQLFEAARKFSVEEAYPEHEFPNTSENAKCVFCQQELNEGAKRLERFNEFVKDKTAKEVLEKGKARSVVLESITSLNLDSLIDETTLSELRDIDHRVEEKVAVQAQWQSRKETVVDCCNRGDWSASIVELPNVVDVLDDISAKIDRSIEEYEQLAKGDRAALDRELSELQARGELRKRLERIVAVIAARDGKRALERCASSISTRGISRKATDLTAKVVTPELEDALNREMKALGIERVKVQFVSRTDRGMTRHKLQLNMPSQYEVSRVLSEGEQRAIAISSFLAESGLSGGQETIVFDDPVSSLDHARREYVAERLAQEAGKRQVVIFTHDLYFLYLLQEISEKLEVNLRDRRVIVGEDGAGIVVEDFPFQGKSTRARIGMLRQLYQQADKLWRDNRREEYERLVRDGYRMLRDSWERAVEELLFNSTVVRFRKSVETNRLRKVAIELEDRQAVEAGMTKSSNYAHDSPLEAGAAIPSPDEFSEDLEMLEAFRGRVSARLN